MFLKFQYPPAYHPMSVTGNARFPDHLRITDEQGENWEIYMGGQKAGKETEGLSQFDQQVGKAIREARAENQAVATPIIPVKTYDPLEEKCINLLSLENLQKSLVEGIMADCQDSVDRERLLTLLTMRELRPSEVADTPVHDDAKKKELKSWTDNDVC